LNAASATLCRLSQTVSINLAWSRHVIQSKFQGPNNISEVTEARIVKFLAQVGYIKCYQKDDISPPKWAWLWSRDRFLKFCRLHYVARRAGLLATADACYGLPCGVYLSSLWSPYGIGQTIIFSSCFFFLLLSSFFLA